jgi:hypothetical protein
MSLLTPGGPTGNTYGNTYGHSVPRRSQGGAGGRAEARGFDIGPPSRIILHLKNSRDNTENHASNPMHAGQRYLLVGSRQFQCPIAHATPSSTNQNPISATPPVHIPLEGSSLLLLYAQLRHPWDALLRGINTYPAVAQ